MSAPIETGGPVPLGDDGIDVMQDHAKRQDLQRREARREKDLADLEAFEQEEASKTAQQPQPTSDVQPDAQGGNQDPAAQGDSQTDGPGFLETAGNVAKTAVGIADSLVPYPSQVVGGALAEAKQVPLAIRDTLDWLSSWMPQVGIVIGGEDLISIKSGDELKDVGLVNQVTEAISSSVPEIGPREGGGGEMARAMAQFLTGFAAAAALPGIKALGAIGTAGKLTSAAIRGAISDFSSFDPHQERLANLVESFPALENPVTEYLSANPDDSAVEGRFKNALEGLGLGVVTEGLFRGVKAIAKYRKAKAAMKPVEAVTGELESLEKTVDIQKTALHDLLGDPEKPMFDVTPMDVPEEEAARILAEGGDNAAERAAAAVPRGTKGEAGSRIMVNWSTQNTPDDVRALIQDMADKFAPEPGRVSWEQTTLEAQEVDAFKALMDRSPSGVLNRAEVRAVRELWGQSGRKLKDTIDLVNADPSDINKIAFRKMLNVHTMIQEQALGARAESARSLNAWAIPAGDTVGFTLQMDDLKRMVGDQGTTEEMASRLGKLYDMGRIDAADGMVYGSKWARTKDAVTQLWYFSLLSGPHTHMRNLISNTSVLPLQLMEQKTAAFLSQTMGSGEIFHEEIGARIFGMLQGFSDAFRISAKGRALLKEGLEQPAFAGKKIADNAEEFGGFWKTLATGQSGHGIGKVDERVFGAFSPEKLGVAESSPIASVLSVIDTATTSTGRALAAGDEIFKTANFRMELNAQATRKAMSEIRAGTLSPDDYVDRVTTLINEPDEAMKLMANKTAQEFTFTSVMPPDSRVVPMLRAIRNFPVVGKVVMPFVNVSYNLGRFAYQRTPLALGMKSYKDAIKQGGAAADTARAKMLVGSGILAVFSELALQGRITGDGPSDPRERDALRRMGWQPNSFAVGELHKVGNHMVADRYFSIRGMEPIATTALIAANTVEILAAAGDDDDTRLDELTFATAFAIADQATSGTYMTGVTNMLNAMHDWYRNGDWFVNSTGGSLVPTGLATITRANDPIVREVEDLIDALKARTPGLSKDLPAKHDAWGREITRDSGLGHAYDILSPLYSSKWDPEPIDEELAKQEAYIGNPKRTVSFGSIEIDLRDYKGAYQRWVKLAGNEITTDEHGSPIFAGQFVSEGGTMLEELNSLVSGTHQFSAIYDGMGDGPYGTKVLMIKEIIKAYRAEAKKQLLDEYPEIRTEVNLKLHAKPGRFDFGIDQAQLEGLQ